MACKESIISANHAYLVKSCFSYKTGVDQGVIKNYAALTVAVNVSVHRALDDTVLSLRKAIHCSATSSNLGIDPSMDSQAITLPIHKPVWVKLYLNKH